jgi:hypothetical protein
VAVRIIVAVLAILVSGCAQDPAQVRASGVLRQIELRGDFKTSGDCVLRVANGQQYESSAKFDDKLRKVEVVAKTTLVGQGNHTAWVMEIQEYQGRSRGQLHYSRLNYPFERDLPELFKQCSA